MLSDPRVQLLVAGLAPEYVKSVIRAVQAEARAGDLGPDEVVEMARLRLAVGPSSLRRVLNATGIVVHTNLGRAPLSAAALEAIEQAAGYVDVELDLTSGVRAARGRGALAALRSAVPSAEDAIVVNNGAAALVLATTALAAGREVIVSRGELVEIGDGFRLPALIESTGARLREVGTTNRTHLRDYAEAIGPQTGCILKVHPGNFWMGGFTAEVAPAALATLAVPIVMDIGSGLLAPDPALPDEPDAATALAGGAALVTASGDKLLGGPQAGIVLGEADLVQRLRRHPLARALRVDKLTLAALEATLQGPPPPVTRYRSADSAALRERCERLVVAIAAGAIAVGAGSGAGRLVQSSGRVGGGGAPGVPLPGWALELPSGCAAALRVGRPPVLARVDKGRCLVDLRCVDPTDDHLLAAAVLAALAADSGERD